MNTPPITWIYVTAPSADVAAALGRGAVAARLAACANVFPAVRSFYWWNGEVQDDAEAVVVLKTTAPLVDALTAHLVAAHPYDVPCVVALPVAAGHAPFIAWVEASVDPPKP